ncbi:MAG TPA: hypothetical protein VKC59_05410, partial [Candidatus Limnocylindrales bacterium]|nr:hypothetical protein [Candidatus Limnocylindrales bacterium]
MLGDTVTLFGRGYGHGVGMSQYGARGRAIAGEDAATILAHYYEGTTLSALDPASRIRVLVLYRLVASDSHPLEIAGRATPWTIDGIDASFPPDARLQLSHPAGLPIGTWRLVILAADGTSLYDGPPPADIVIRPATDDGRLQLTSKPTRFNVYRGVLHVITTSTSTRVSVLNDIP